MADEFERIELNPSGTMLVALIRDHASRYFGSNKAFAQEVGVSEKTISKWMKEMDERFHRPAKVAAWRKSFSRARETA